MAMTSHQPYLVILNPCHSGSAELEGDPVQGRYHDMGYDIRTINRTFWKEQFTKLFFDLVGFFTTRALQFGLAKWS